MSWGIAGSAVPKRGVQRKLDTKSLETRVSNIDLSRLCAKQALITDFFRAKTVTDNVNKGCVKRTGFVLKFMLFVIGL